MNEPCPSHDHVQRGLPDKTKSIARRIAVHAGGAGAAAATVAVLSVLVLFSVGNAPLIGWDEWILATISLRVARWWIPARSWYDLLSPTGFPYPPLFFWMGGGLAWLFGPSYFILRVPATLSLAGCSATATLLAGAFGKRRAAWSTAVLCILHMPFGFHDLVTIDFLMTFWVLLSLLLLVKCLGKDSFPLLYLAIVAGGIACFSKYHAVIWHGFLCATVLVAPKTRAMLRGLRIPLLMLAAGLFPALILAIQGLTWKFYGYQKTHFAEGLWTMSWTSIVEHPLTGEFVRAGSDYYAMVLSANPGPGVCLLGVIGVVALLMRKRWIALVPLLFAILWMVWASSSSIKHARYIIPFVYVCLVFAGHGFAVLSNRDGKLRFVTVALAVLLALIGFQGLTARRGDYMETARLHERVFALIDEKVPQDAVLVTDSFPLRRWDGGVLPSVPRKVIWVDTPGWEDKATHVLTQESTFAVMEKGTIFGSSEYVEARQSILSAWRVVIDEGRGSDRIRLLAKPADDEGDADAGS